MLTGINFQFDNVTPVKTTCVGKRTKSVFFRTKSLRRVIMSATWSKYYCFNQSVHEPEVYNQSEVRMLSAHADEILFITSKFVF